MRTTLLIAALVAVTACESPSQNEAGAPQLSQIKRECDYQRQPFEVAWSCVRTGFNYPSPNPDVKALYLATGDFIATQVTEGKMTQAVARYAEAEALYKAQQAVMQRDQAQQSLRTQRAAVMVGAMAINQQQRPVTCTRYGNQVTCQ